jgi:hypothetical protein
VAAKRLDKSINLALTLQMLYEQGDEAIDAALARLAAVTKQLGDAYTRWHELESRSS